MALPDPTLVFLDTLPFAVAVRDLVAEATAQTHIPECFLNLVKTAINT